MAEFNWATLGCGVIAHQLADAMKAKGRTLYSVANRTYDKAISFAEEYGILLKEDSELKNYLMTLAISTLNKLLKAEKKIQEKENP